MAERFVFVKRERIGNLDIAYFEPEKGNRKRR